MTPLKPTAFRIEADLLDALQEIKRRDGVPVSEQVRRALQAWLESKGVMKTERKRASPASAPNPSTEVSRSSGLPPFYGNPTTLEVPMRCAIYARVSTFDQEPENQLAELRRYVAARGWTAVEYVDRGVSGAKDRRPALDRLLTDARRRRFDVLVVLAARSPRPQPPAPDHAARGAPGARRRVRHRSTRASTPRRRPASSRCTSSGRSRSSSARASRNASRRACSAPGRRGSGSGDHGRCEPTIAVPGGSVREAARVWGVSKSTAARWINAGGRRHSISA